MDLQCINIHSFIALKKHPFAIENRYFDRNWPTIDFITIFDIKSENFQLKMAKNWLGNEIFDRFWPIFDVKSENFELKMTKTWVCNDIFDLFLTWKVKIFNWKWPKLEFVMTFLTLFFRYKWKFWTEMQKESFFSQVLTL